MLKTMLHSIPLTESYVKRHKKTVEVLKQSDQNCLRPVEDEAVLHDVLKLMKNLSGETNGCSTIPDA